MPKTKIEGLIIHVQPSVTEKGFMFDVFTSEDQVDTGNSEDGGLCTGTLGDALEMAADCARDVLKKHGFRKGIR